ncbi:cytochrome c oxidase subunit 4 [Kineosporiaceae bacterium SCSIO 59966]|nr:cytochrome c oxidase subunit 4 [Kineosporiaceae bacterium SCSIO 59966]
MKIETLVFGMGVFFFTPVAVIYGLLSSWEPVGTAALALTAGMSGLVGAYLWLTGRRIGERPEDNPQGEIADVSGEYGEFSPWSWWPLPLALSGAIIFAGLAVGWWLVLIGIGFSAIALVGWVYEYYRGAHAH